jgi:hypothetical protein
VQIKFQNRLSFKESQHGVILGASISTLSHSSFFQGTGGDFVFLQSLLLEALFFFGGKFSHAGNYILKTAIQNDDF